MIDLRLTKQEKKDLTEDEIEIAMARKLEILILPQLRRHIRFFYAGGNLKGKAKAYKDSHDIGDIEEVLNSDKGEIISTVCKPVCTMAAEILRDNGIAADTVSCDTDIFRHTDVLMTTKSGKKYIINYLEDMEMIQTGMKTPDFASKAYYERRYKKFEGGKTTDGKRLDGIDFLPEERLDLIDQNLGYKKYNMYMNSVIAQIKKEFENYREVMAENEWMGKKLDLIQSNETISDIEMEKRRKEIYDKYQQMSDDEVLESKLDWIFEYFNDRMDINGYTDFVMYYSRLLLKEVLSKEEYGKIKRFDCFVYPEDMPEDSKLKEIINFDNREDTNKDRFAMVRCNGKYYVFSTKPNSYLKITEEELEEMRKYIKISESSRPSDLMLYLCDRGNALPLVFHPLGGKFLNERAELIDPDLSEEERKKAIEELSRNIKTTDEPVTSILIPYPDGTTKYIYIDDNDELVVKTKGKKTIYHYNEQNDTFEEEISHEERE